MPLFDDNFQRLSRLQNIFGPQNPIGGANPPGITPPIAPPNPMQQDMGQYQPDTRASDMLYQMINQMPQRNQPGIGRKILASIGGIGGGPKLADQMLYQPYYQQMQDWQTKLGPIEKLASEERMGNINMRQLYDAMMRDKSAGERLDIQKSAEERKAKEGEANIAIRKQRAATYDFKARNPNHVIKQDKDGNLIGINPQDDSVQYITDEDGNPIKGDKLSDYDKLNLQISGQKEVARVRGEEARKTEAVKETGRQADIRARGAQARATKTTETASSRKTALAKDKQLSVSQDAAAYKLARQQYIQDNPSHAKFWNPDGSPASKAEDNDEYVSAVEDIRRRYNVIKSRTVGKPGTIAAPAARVKVKGPKGLSGTVSAEDAKHLPEGWSVVQ